MPELPEVEVTRRSFVDAISGARVLMVQLGKTLRWPLGCEPAILADRVVTGVRRRGKYLLLDLDKGMLLLHLGMSGSLRFTPAPEPMGPHDHFDLLTSAGVLRLNDPRRFGAVVYAASPSEPVVQRLLGKLGMEPLSDDFHQDVFVTGLRASRAAVKQVLLNGRLVVGVGNIYASEALFLAGIRPTTMAARIGPERAKKLYEAIRQVLELAVQRGGSTLRNFSSADGSVGHFQSEAHVYGREGIPCRVCGTAVRMVRQGQRSSFFCPRCQRA